MISSCAVSGRIDLVGRSPSEENRDLVRLAKADGVDVISLSGAPSGRLPEHVVDAIDAAARIETHSIHSAGLPELRRAIAQRVQATTGVSVDPESQVVVTNGAMHALLVATLALSDEGDEVIIPTPCFFFGGIFELGGLRTVYVPSAARDGWAPDFSRLRAALGIRAKLICLTTPNNPTGYLLSSCDLDELASLIEGRDVWLLSDESYEVMTFDGRRHLSPMSHPDLRNRTITIQTFSKTFRLRDQRVGYAIAPNARVGRAIRSAVEWSVLSVSHISQRAAIAALEGPQDWVDQMVAEVRGNRDVMQSQLGQSNEISWVHPVAGPYLYIDVSVLGPAKEVSRQLLTKYGVATVSGPAFKEGTHVRVPFGGPSSRIREAGNRLAEAFSEMASRPIMPLVSAK